MSNTEDTEYAQPVSDQSTSKYTRKKEQLDCYLKAQVRIGTVDKELVERAWKALQLLIQYKKRIDLPAVGVGESSQILFEWDRGYHHLELEVFITGEAELFYLNRETNKSCEDYYFIESSNILLADEQMKLALDDFLRRNEP